MINDCPLWHMKDCVIDRIKKGEPVDMGNQESEKERIDNAVEEILENGGEVNRKVGARMTVDDLIYDELRNIHGTIAGMEQPVPVLECRLDETENPNSTETLKNILYALEQVVENTSKEEKKAENWGENQRLKILREQNDEMRNILEEVHNKACEISKLKDQIVKDANDLAKNRTHYLACNSFYFDAAIENAKDIENVIPSKYLPYTEKVEDPFSEENE